jgi:ABC-2 type transport system ATP-binding protein
MTGAFELRGVTKRYGGTTALHDVTVQVPAGSITGLVGRNGSGKTTLLRHVTGMVLPDEGKCVTLGRPAERLGRFELSRMGVVHQDDALPEWMRASQLLGYVSSFYEVWDRELERSLLSRLEIDPAARVGTLSPGMKQRLALIVATCHRPELLLLDEPLDHLDPMARRDLLAMLLEFFAPDATSIVVSSHMLRDIEPVVDRILCLDRGRVTAHDGLDDLKERYVEWIVTSPEGRLPKSFTESYIVSASGDAHRARLIVRDGGAHAASFGDTYRAVVEPRSLNLEGLFPLLVNGEDAHGATVTMNPSETGPS